MPVTCAWVVLLLCPGFVAAAVSPEGAARPAQAGAHGNVDKAAAGGAGVPAASC